MKKIIFALMLIVVLVLSGCKAADTVDAADAVVEAKGVTEQKWTYSFFTGVCVYDGGSQDILCKDLVTKDETLLTNLIGVKASEGFELEEVVVTTRGESLTQTFIFRKAYVEPVLAE